MNYESTFICAPDLPTEKVEDLTTKASKVIENSKGQVKTIQQLGKKKLAYPINKFREGSYVYMELEGSGEMVSALENFFKFTDGIMRYLTVKVEKKKAAAKPVSAPAPSPNSIQAPSAVEAKNEPATEQSPSS
ncbi:MAG: 30S ribosomal protein S6 [Elusimicrobiota bacterium]|jgi:small subunit ribosomal protein S6|nr:30S ribosomal protein S6 [Elusimicrobiota bacterium]